MTELLLAASLAAVAGAATSSKASSPVVLVVVDEASEKAFGWPLSGGALAEGLAKIEAGKPAAVALKFFVEGEGGSGAAPLATALARYKNVYLQCAGVDDGEAPDEDLLKPSIIPGGEGADFDDKPFVLFPPKALARAAAGVGFVHVKLDPKSGAAERWQAVSMAGGRRYASLALLLAGRVRGVAPSAMSLEPAKGDRWTLSGGKLSLALDPEGALPIRLTVPGKGRPRWSFADVRSGKVPASSFTGKVVVLGPDLPGRDDNGIKTAVDARHPKVELFADAVATLLKR